MPNHVKNVVKMEGITNLPLFVEEDGKKCFEYALQKADEFARIIDEGREEGEVKQIIHKGGRETFRKRYGCSYL